MIYNKLIYILLLFAGIAFAEDMCVNLCISCDSEDMAASGSCLKISETCNCTELMQAFRLEQMNFEKEKETLAKALMEACDKQVCSRDIALSNKKFITMQKGKTRLPVDTIYGKVLKIEEMYVPAKPAAVEPLAPMNEQCAGICEPCTIDRDTLVQKIEAGDTLFEYEDKMCEKIDSTCHCSEYAVNEYRVEQSRIQDSVYEDHLNENRREQSLSLAEKLLNKCLVTDTCIFSLVLHKKTLRVVDIYNVQKEDPARAIAFLKSLNPPAAEPPKDTIVENPEDSVAAVVKSEMDSSKKIDQPQDSAVAAVLKSPEKKRIGYNVLMFYYGEFLEDEFGGNSIEESAGTETGFTWFYRWYFYSAGSFQAGMGLSSHYADGDFDKLIGSKNAEVYFQYHNLAIEWPLAFRFGVPIHKYIAPYVSGTLTIRKPLYMWLDYDVDVEYDYYYYDSNYGISSHQWQEEGGTFHTGFYEFSDWEFTIFLGFGLEINRIFSIECQKIFASGNLYGGHHYETLLDKTYFRVNFQYAW